LARVIGHIDLDYFYAQVEEVENPNLRSVPLVVCVFSGRTENSGVVSTANYRARELGVRSGIPIAVAKSRLKDTDAKFVPMDRAKYEEYSNQVMGIVRDHVDVLEQTGIDEAFFDITKRSGGDYGAAAGIAREIKETILGHERLTCSIGIAPSKVVAKLASDFRKPDGLTVVLPENLQRFAWPMPVEKLYGVGPKSGRILKEIGVATIGDLAIKDLDSLDGVFDRKFSVYLHNASNGLDDEPVVTTGEAKQLSRIITLKKDSLDADDIFDQLSPAIDDLHRKILEREVFFRSVSIIGILTDLSIRTRTRTGEAPSRDLVSLRKAARELLVSLLGEGHELRRVGIRVGDLSEAKEQSSLSEFVG
jgi:DNA polymerase IV (archaeal DinB-like DNA polymerase)